MSSRCPYRWALSRDPVLGTRDLYIYGDGAELPYDPPGMREMVSTIAETIDLGDIERTLCRTAVTNGPYEGFRPLSTYIRYSGPAPGAKSSQRVLNIREASPEDWPLLSHLYEDALTQGYTGAGYDVDLEAVRRFLEQDMFEDFESGSLRAFVATNKSGGIAHISWQEDEDEVSGEPYWELFDVHKVHDAESHVVPELVAALLRVAEETDIRVVGEVSWQLDGGHEAVSERLLASGWHPIYMLMEQSST